jgi:hypothetical protein
MKIEIELPGDYVGQLEEAGFTQEQIAEYIKETVSCWIEDIYAFHEDMKDFIQNMKDYYNC